ncbi:MAG TPA: gephyrin-like molybdotransferase Glp [Roseiflexaceae bacterium]|nr:gephyrin-like molybdotransferase Glp [Roseiflexaceae bacterium]
MDTELNTQNSKRNTPDMSVEAALERVLAACAPREPTDLAVWEATGAVLARPVLAPHDLPPFANSGMDGFAVRAADLADATRLQPVALPVAGAVQAGDSAAPPLPPGATLRIMTGAPLPPGADAVVPIEDVAAEGAQVSFFEPTAPGRHVRPAGEDVAAGAVAIPAGRALRAAEIGLLAALGVARVAVVRPPRVAIISTGDELLLPDEAGEGAPPPGRLRDANGPALAAFVAEQGAQPLALGIARDTHSALQAKIDAALTAGADLILTSAGASAGDFDIVSGLMRDSGALELWRVNLKPGRPLLFGRVADAAGRTAPLLGLPGNPASALIVAALFVRPAIARLRGLDQPPPDRVQARLVSPQRGGPRRHYVRARLEWTPDGYRASTDGIGGGSGALTTLVRANALLVIPEGTGRLEVGSVVEAILL